MLDDDGGPKAGHRVWNVRFRSELHDRDARSMELHVKTLAPLPAVVERQQNLVALPGQGERDVNGHAAGASAQRADDTDDSARREALDAPG